VTIPGEVNQMIGRAYQCVFIGALEASIRGFESKFDVQSEPEKVSFKARTGKQYSFDFGGVYSQQWYRGEVLGECKGYSKAGSLLTEFRSFLAKAYVTSADYTRHRNDCFWFITNVPFGCSEGSGIRNYDFIRATLTDAVRPEVKEILGDSHVDLTLTWALAARIGVFILTDSFLMNAELSYKVAEGESLWTILKKFHAGRAPSSFGFMANQIASKNNLASPSKLRSGRRIRLSWQGIPGAAGGGFGGF
jgi:LysM domain